MTQSHKGDMSEHRRNGPVVLSLEEINAKFRAEIGPLLIEHSAGSPGHYLLSGKKEQTQGFGTRHYLVLQIEGCLPHKQKAGNGFMRQEQYK